jgi:4-amino-4-deoxy-L-arabinose transferase-like glycosyltransferase
VLAATLVGFAFLTKMLQAFLVLPAFAAAWLVAAPVGIGRRLRGLALATVALVVSAGWWVAGVELWPADARPYIGGSQTNSVLELMLGYNGFGRLTGDEVGSVGGMRVLGQSGGGWGATGLTRLLAAQFGGQASWLLPAAVVLLVALLWWTRRAPRTDRLRAAAVLWGGWLVVTSAVFSLMQGIFHAYYLVALAPAVAALVSVGAVVLWRWQAALAPRVTLAAVLGLTALWAFGLLRRTPEWHPWLAWAVLGAGAVGVVALLAMHRLPRPAVAATAAVAVAAALAGPAAYSLVTAATPHQGAIPSAGPAATGRGPAFFGRTPPPGAVLRAPGAGRGLTLGGFGGLLDARTPPAAVVELLRQDAAAYTWAAAAVGSINAAAYQLATGEPVMPLGGFNGTDPSPTLERFQQLVAAGQVHCLVGGAGPGGTQSGGSEDARQIAEWVEHTFRPVTIDGVRLYDLTDAR